MTNDSTARLNLPYLVEGQAMKHLTINEALAALDGLVCAAVTSRTTAAQPDAPEVGAAYVLPAGRSGAEWDLHPAGALLRFDEAGWTALATPLGMVAWDTDAEQLIVRATAGWEPLSATLRALDDLQRVGVGTRADADNPFSARLNKALFTARPEEEGGDGDLRLALNKAHSSDVQSLLFQSGWTTRAELGLIGDDDLSLKVHAGGSPRPVLRVETATGRFSLGDEGAPVGVLHVRSATERTVVQSDSAAYKSSLLLLNGDVGAQAGSGMLFGAGGDGVSTGFIGGVGAQRIDEASNSRTTLRVLSGGVHSGTDASGVFYLEGGASGPKVVANARVGIGVAEPTARLHVDGAVRVKALAKADLPPAASEGAGAVLMVSDEAGGATLAFSDGSAWRRVTDRAVVS